MQSTDDEAEVSSDSKEGLKLQQDESIDKAVRYAISVMWRSMESADAQKDGFATIYSVLCPKNGKLHINTISTVREALENSGGLQTIRKALENFTSDEEVQKMGLAIYPELHSLLSRLDAMTENKRKVMEDSILHFAELTFQSRIFHAALDAMGKNKNNVDIQFSGVCLISLVLHTKLRFHLTTRRMNLLGFVLNAMESAPTSEELQAKACGALREILESVEESSKGRIAKVVFNSVDCHFHSEAVQFLGWSVLDHLCRSCADIFYLLIPLGKTKVLNTLSRSLVEHKGNQKFLNVGSALFEALVHSALTCPVLEIDPEVYMAIMQNCEAHDKGESVDAAYEKMLESLRRLPDAGQVGFRIHVECAHRFLRSGKLERARQMVKSCMASVSEGQQPLADATSWHTLGLVLDTLGEHETAVDVLTRALQVASDSISRGLIKTSLAHALQNLAGQWQETVAQMENDYAKEQAELVSDGANSLTSRT